jgi:uncharacterized protein (DUF1778 family)
VAAETRKTLESNERDRPLSAEESLPDRRHFVLAFEGWKRFNDVMSAPPGPAPRLAKLLNEPSVFEKGNL